MNCVTPSPFFNSFAATFIPQLYSLAPGYFSDVCSAEQWLALDVHISKTIQDFSLKGWRVGSAAYAHCVRYVRWHTVRCENVSLQHDPTMSPCRVNSPVAANGLCRVNSPVAAKELINYIITGKIHCRRNMGQACGTIDWNMSVRCAFRQKFHDPSTIFSPSVRSLKW